jgi:hypothetical protein
MSPTPFPHPDSPLVVLDTDELIAGSHISGIPDPRGSMLQDHRQSEKFCASQLLV